MLRSGVKLFKKFGDRKEQVNKHGVNQELVPFSWLSIGMGFVAFVLFLIPKTRKNFVTLNIGTLLIYWSVYVEKGIALIIPGFTPDVLGQIYVYTPSMTEIRTAVMIFALGSLLFTFLVKVAIAIVFENYNIDLISKKKQSATIRA